MESRGFFENPFAVILTLATIASVIWTLWAIRRLRAVSPVEFAPCQPRRLQPVGWQKRGLIASLRRLTFDPRVELPDDGWLDIVFRSRRSWEPFIEKWFRDQELAVILRRIRRELRERAGV